MSQGIVTGHVLPCLPQRCAHFLPSRPFAPSTLEGRLSDKPVLLGALSCPLTLLTSITAQSGPDIGFKVAATVFAWLYGQYNQPSETRPWPRLLMPTLCTTVRLCVVISSPSFTHPLFGVSRTSLHRAAWACNSSFFTVRSYFPYPAGVLHFPSVFSAVAHLGKPPPL